MSDDFATKVREEALQINKGKCPKCKRALNDDKVCRRCKRTYIAAKDAEGVWYVITKDMS